MEEKMDYEEFAPYFGPWADRFKPFIESKEMYDIYQKIKADAFKEVNGKTVRKEYIVPANDATFRSFQKSSPKNIKSVWFLMDPYPRRYKPVAGEKVGRFQATGIPMDCTNSPDGKLQPSLEFFYDGLDEHMGKKVERSADLSYLLDQGILLLNSDLTCKLNKTGSHAGLWEPFMKFFLEELMGGNTGIIYVLAGKESERMAKYIMPVGNYIYKVEHPSAAQYSHQPWRHKNIFKTTDTILKQNNNEVIYWDKKDWDAANEPPF